MQATHHAPLAPGIDQACGHDGATSSMRRRSPRLRFERKRHSIPIAENSQRSADRFASKFASGCSRSEIMTKRQTI